MVRMVDCGDVDSPAAGRHALKSRPPGLASRSALHLVSASPSLCSAPSAPASAACASAAWAKQSMKAALGRQTRAVSPLPSFACVVLFALCCCGLFEPCGQPAGHHHVWATILQSRLANFCLPSSPLSAQFSYTFRHCKSASQQKQQVANGSHGCCCGCRPVTTLPGVGELKRDFRAGFDASVPSPIEALQLDEWSQQLCEELPYLPLPTSSPVGVCRKRTAVSTCQVQKRCMAPRSSSPPRPC